MAQATMTALDALLKEVYSVRLQSQLNSEQTASKRLMRSKEGIIDTVGGKYVNFPIKVGRNQGIGNRSENEQLPDADRTKWLEVIVPLTHCYGTLRLTGQLIELAETNAQAFSSAMDEEMDDIKEGVKHDWERQMFGDGTGLLASVTADGANTVTVNNIQYLEEGMIIDIRTRSNGASVAAQRTITAINESTLVVTYDGADVAATANEGLYRYNNYASGTSRELSGFAKIFSDTTTLHGINPASAGNGKWKATVDANGGVNRALSEGLMILNVDRVRAKGGGKTSVIFGGLGVRRAYFNLLVQQRRYTDTKNYAGGFQGLSFMHGSDIPMVEVVDAPPNKMWGVDESKMKIFQNREWHFGNEDGSILKWVQNYDAWTAFIKKYSELGTTQRNAHWLLDDLIEG